MREGSRWKTHRTPIYKCLYTYLRNNYIFQMFSVLEQTIQLPLIVFSVWVVPATTTTKISRYKWVKGQPAGILIYDLIFGVWWNAQCLFCFFYRPFEKENSAKSFIKCTYRCIKHKSTGYATKYPTPLNYKCFNQIFPKFLVAHHLDCSVSH